MKAVLAILGLILPSVSFANEDAAYFILRETNSTLGIIALVTFCLAYALVISEEYIHMRKSKPVVLAAGIIWFVVALISKQHGNSHLMEAAVKHNILEYGELFLFLLSAMTYVNALEERQVFGALRSYLVRKGLTLKQLFWVTGFLAFFISPVADNLTTALLMCAVLLAVGQNNKKFISLGCINIVVAANAGGAFSPFGDITTLMVWQAGVVDFHDFFHIFIPSLVSFLIPAAIMSFAIPSGRPDATDQEDISMLFGAKRMLALFALTIFTAVAFHNFLSLPPALGMMTGLGYLKLFGYYIKMSGKGYPAVDTENLDFSQVQKYDILRKVQRAEWDTLLFFYGVMLCVGGLATIGYLESVSVFLYDDMGKYLGMSALHEETPANIVIGIISAIIDNIPVMFAVLTMNPEMSQGQWLLVTLTAGIGGSLLSIGSAAGVALMGQSKGAYTFFSHLKWTWAIFLGYVAGIGAHIWLNGYEFLQKSY